MPQGSSGGPDSSAAQTTIYRPAATLTVTAPPSAAGRSVAVDPQGTLIGRDGTCHLALANHHISRRHAVVRLRDGQYEIEDFGSTNGTRLNGEPVTGTRALHDGDRLAFADVEIDFQLGNARSTPSVRSRPPVDEAWHPHDSTTSRPTLAQARENRPQSLRRELHQAPGFSAWALLLAVGGSVVGTVLTGATGTGQWGTLAGAALGPVVSTVFSTKRTGEKGRVRGAAILIMSLGALLITWAGFSVTDAAAGKSVVPGADNRSSTFPEITGNGSAGQPDARPPSDPTHSVTSAPTSTLAPTVQIDPVQCGSVDVGSVKLCPTTTIKYNGSGRLHITGVEVTGPQSGDFTPGQECMDTWLSPDETCQMTVQFRPSVATERNATLVVHQNLPRPDRGTEALLTGTGTASEKPDPSTCLTGFIWREAIPGDHVCVTPETRSRSQEDNRLASSRRVG
jgi:pSer/pThr/pTyr-binding forkhead associated (FHA) protein